MMRPTKSVASGSRQRAKERAPFTAEFASKLICREPCPLGARKPNFHHALSEMNVNDATVHGFRSSFPDWAGNGFDLPARSY